MAHIIKYKISTQETFIYHHYNQIFNKGNCHRETVKCRRSGFTNLWMRPEPARATEKATQFSPRATQSQPDLTRAS